MRQAIDEGFILDVLRNYTTYKTYYRLIKSIEDDPRVDKRRAARALARFMSMHPHNIAQKTEVMVEHFRHFTMHKIGGKAKAMVVTSSRLHAVRYKQAFDKKLFQNNYGKLKTTAGNGAKRSDRIVLGRQVTPVTSLRSVPDQPSVGARCFDAVIVKQFLTHQRTTCVSSSSFIPCIPKRLSPN